MEQKPSYVTYLLANHCMPTLMKMKPSSLVCINKSKVTHFAGFNEEMKQELKPFDCLSMILYENSFYQILLIYNRKLLGKVLKKKENITFLRSVGYSVIKKDTETVLETLTLRYQAYKGDRGCYGNQDFYHYQDYRNQRCYKLKGYNEEQECYEFSNNRGYFLENRREIGQNDWPDVDIFPHEIGIILGYPEEDVRSFIQKQGNDYLLSGIWKVYHNVKRARKVFDRYAKMREKALSMVMSGKKLSECKNNR